MIVGHEDGYQRVAGGLMNFLTCLGMVFPPYAYAAWVGESTADTVIDKDKIMNEESIKEEFNGLVANCVDFTKKVLPCLNNK